MPQHQKPYANNKMHLKEYPCPMKPRREPTQNFEDEYLKKLFRTHGITREQHEATMERRAEGKERKLLEEMEARKRTEIASEATAAPTLSKFESDHKELQHELKNSFVFVREEPAAAINQNAANRFRLFSTIASSISNAAAYLSPFGKKG